MTDIKLGTVTNTTDCLYVRLDGAEEDTPVMRASSYNPTVGDRVAVMLLGTRYVAAFALVPTFTLRLKEG